MIACTLLSLLLMVCLVVRGLLVPSDRKRAARLFWVLLASTLVGAVAQMIANALSRFRPLKYDLFVYQADGFLGLQPSFVLGCFAAAHPWLGMTLAIAYSVLPVAVALVYGAYLWFGTEREPLTVLKTFALNLVVAPAFYLAFPVSGPAFAFPHFPMEQGRVIPHLVSLNAAPNGMPSIHFSTALLILWLCWRWTLGRVLGSIYLLLIFSSTLAMGQHYLLDLIAAVPYAIGIRWLANWSPRASADLPTYP
jgi:PAP2 superfamily